MSRPASAGRWATPSAGCSRREPPTDSASQSDIPTPQLDPPISAYTQLPSVDISGHLPGDVAGTSDMLHVYVGGTLHAQQQVPTTNDFTVSAVPLAEGPNVITATLVTADGESGPSAPITITFDDMPPPLTLTSPKDGAAVTTATVAVKGTTQPGATVTVHDANTGAIPSVTANAAGAFGVNVTLAQGPNVLTITAVDPAGNRTTKTLTVTHGSGALKAKLTLSWSTMSNKNVASSPLRITVLVNDATGKPITVGATATFTVSPPGQPAIVSGDPPVTLSHGAGSWTRDDRAGRRLARGAAAGRVRDRDGDPRRRPDDHRQGCLHDHEVERFARARTGSGQPASNRPTGAASGASESSQQGWISSPWSGPLRRSRPHVPPIAVTPRRKWRQVAQVVDERVQTQQRAASACRVPQWGHRQVSTRRV